MGPNGQVVSSSIYTDSDGNRVVNGVPFQQNSVPAPAPPPVKTQQQPVRTQTSPQKDKSGAYVPDDRGKWKGN